MKKLLIVSVLSISACAGTESEARESREPSSHTVRPPAAIMGETVDAYGNPLDPEVARCVQRTQIRMGTVAGIFGGEKSVVDDRSMTFASCWCASNGYRSLGRAGTCI